MKDRKETVKDILKIVFFGGIIIWLILWNYTPFKRKHRWLFPALILEKTHSFALGEVFIKGRPNELPKKSSALGGGMCNVRQSFTFHHESSKS